MGAQQSTKLSKKEIKQITADYGIPEAKIHELLKSFRKHCGKTGTISKDAFCELLSGSMSRPLAEKVFVTFDADGNGVMDAHEYVLMMGITHGGTIEQKLKASFQMFDTDGNGGLSPDEIKEMFVLIINQRRAANLPPGGQVPPLDAASEAAIDGVVKIVFSKIDTDGNGEISYEEFLEGYYKYPEICSFFKQL